MSIVADRKAESIALMMGRTAYRDFRNGFASVQRLDDPDAKIKIALGLVQRRTGAVPVKAMETRYASTLIHERFLRRAYDLLPGVAEDVPQRAVHRMAVTLAIRRHAGIKFGRDEIEEYAWIMRVRRETLDHAFKRAGSWLEEVTFDAVARFLAALKEPVDGAKKRA